MVAHFVVPVDTASISGQVGNEYKLRRKRVEGMVGKIE